MVDEDRSGDEGGGGWESTAATRSHISEPAQRLYDLVLDYVERSLASQVELVRTFEAEAAQWAPSVGEVSIDDDDDERLRLTAEGRFSGRVLDEDTGEWEAVASPEGVAAHYDPVDLFNDLADALEELFPGIDEDATTHADEDDARGARAVRAAEAGEESGVPEAHEKLATAEPPGTALQTGPIAPPGWSTSTEAHEPGVGGGSEPFREQLRALEDLRNAGVLTPAQFENAKAHLTHR